MLRKRKEEKKKKEIFKEYIFFMKKKNVLQEQIMQFHERCCQRKVNQLRMWVHEQAYMFSFLFFLQAGAKERMKKRAQNKKQHC